MYPECSFGGLFCTGKGYNIHTKLFVVGFHLELSSDHCFIFMQCFISMNCIELVNLANGPHRRNNFLVIVNPLEISKTNQRIICFNLSKLESAILRLDN